VEYTTAGGVLVKNIYFFKRLKIPLKMRGNYLARKGKENALNYQQQKR
jgi:hypothetical protein